MVHFHIFTNIFLALKLSRLFPLNICNLLQDYLSNRNFFVFHGEHVYQPPISSRSGARGLQWFGILKYYNAQEWEYIFTLERDFNRSPI